MINIIAAIAQKDAIGRKGDLLCHLRKDLQQFKALTSGHTVIMGRKTYMSLPRRPLPNRRNIVISQSEQTLEGAEIARSIEDALKMVHGEDVFVIGGGIIYHEMIEYADRLYITRIHHEWTDADTFFPKINPEDWDLISHEEHQADAENDYDFAFEKYERIKTKTING